MRTRLFLLSTIVAAGLLVAVAFTTAKAATNFQAPRA